MFKEFSHPNVQTIQPLRGDLPRRLDSSGHNSEAEEWPWDEGACEWQTSWKYWSTGPRADRCGRSPRALVWTATRWRSTLGRPARAGFGPGTGPPSEGWAGFVAEVCPELGWARRNGAAWDELAARHDEILERLKVNRPSTVWQRMHDDDGLQASLPSFRRYALAAFPEAYGRRQGITVLRDDPPPGEEARGRLRPPTRRPAKR